MNTSLYARFRHPCLQTVADQAPRPMLQRRGGIDVAAMIVENQGNHCNPPQTLARMLHQDPGV